VQVTLSATDNDGGSGVKTITYRASGAQPIGSTTVSGTSTSLAVSTDGQTTLTYYASDAAGNVEPAQTVTINRDTVPPSITAHRSPAANAAGWNNAAVTVSFACSDATSDIASCPAPITRGADGAGQSVAGTATDNAGNPASATVDNINIDTTPPTLTASLAGSPNAAGWFNGPVSVHWSCGDALSGVAGGCPADTTILGEGTGLTTSATVSDTAGNQTTASSPAVDIDSTAPKTDVGALPLWNNTDVTVVLTPTDALSGVKVTHYRLDDGQVQDSTAVTTAVTISAEGSHTLTYWSEDYAGNSEAHKTVQIDIDKTPPTIGHILDPLPNANGWNKGAVTVTFQCADALSDVASCTSPQTVSAEGKNQQVLGTAVDNAGNTATDPAAVSVDMTAPVITATVDRGPDSNGWYNHAVTVSFACSDALSGIALSPTGAEDCPAAQTLGEGANQSAGATVYDAADNSASDAVHGINVDMSAPAISGTAVNADGTPRSANANGWYSSNVFVAWTCSDPALADGAPGSGIAGACPGTSMVSGEGADLAASASVSDRAGNTTTSTLEHLKIDQTPPSTTVSVPAPNSRSWYAGPIRVTLTARDGLSGVDATYYTVDGGAPQAYSGPFTFSSGGTHTIAYWSVDKAGNVEDSAQPGHSITVQIDNIPPTIYGHRTPSANAYGWNNGPVTVTFDCADAETGVAGCVGDGTVVSGEGANQAVTGVATDLAGNAASATVDGINIDLTRPDLSGAPTTSANGAGWYNGDVTIDWTASDGLSGIDPTTQPPDSVITGEGTGLTASASVKDKAGNRTMARSAAVNIDRTAPTISGQVVDDEGSPRAANAAGWYNSSVRVYFTCADPALADGSKGSGVATCPSDAILNADGAGQSVSGSATDMAGNSSAPTTVGSINIDSQAPQSFASLSCSGQNGWCTGTSATVVLTATDQARLSGVKEIHYSVNGGPEQVVPGKAATVGVPLDASSGTATVQFYAVDNAGNREQPNTDAIQYDNIAPVVTHTVNPVPNAAGWNKDNVTVHFNATDDAAGSGLDPSSVTPDQVLSAETASVTVTGQAADSAGNVGTDKVTVKLDKTPPTISGAATTSPNANGWYNGPVTVHFTCGDLLSGVASCPGDVTLTANAANQSVTRAAADYAGNTASATVAGINIDAVAPGVSIGGVKDGAIYTLGVVPTPTCTASDSLSGLAGPCATSLVGGTSNGVGTYTYTAKAIDKAGNTTTVTATYRVTYRWDGFLQPVNDTAHHTGLATSIFKAGSTVPMKVQLKQADGTLVQATTAPVWLTPVKGSPTTAPVDESAYSTAVTGSATYAWDGTGQQYQYNWGTASAQAGYYWRVGVRLDDGQTYYVNIGLR
jgi:hypothetical protein